jgi:hypothetical protein
MKLITVATDNQGYFPWLMLSCKKYGVTPEILGWGQKWQGFNWRNKLMIEYLDQLPEKEVVCFIDAYDMIVINDIRRLEAEFIKFNKETGYEFVVGCEHIMNAFSKVFAVAKFGRCKGVNINAGMYMGYAGKVRSVLNSIFLGNNNYTADDQVLLTAYCRNYSNEVYIDCGQRFFISIVKPYMNIDNVIDVRQSNAFFLHGNCFTRLDNIIVSLGYKYTELDRSRINRYIMIYTYKKYWLNYVVGAIVMCTIFIIVYTLIKVIRR